jgi:SAM-dependent methyltransferase
LWIASVRAAVPDRQRDGSRMHELDAARRLLADMTAADPRLTGVEVVDVSTPALLERHGIVGGVCVVGAKAQKLTPQQVQAWRDSYRRLDGYEFVGVDIEAGLNVDVVADLCSPTLEQDHPQMVGRFGLVVCGALLEHVKDPFRAARNVAALIRPGGHLYYLGPWVWGFHAYPDDYWRFSFPALQQLFPSLTWKEWWYASTDKRIGIKVPRLSDERTYLQIVTPRGKKPRHLGELITDRAMPYLNVGAIGQRVQG